jgi:hypothetical protein
MSLLGVPISRYVEVHDSEQILSATRLTPADRPAHLYRHTPADWCWPSNKPATTWLDTRPN